MLGWILIHFNLIQGSWWITIPVLLFACLGFDRTISPDRFIEDTRIHDFVAEELDVPHKAVMTGQSHPGDVTPNLSVEQGADGKPPEAAQPPY